MRLEARDLCFRYGEGGRPLIERLNFSVETGERVALVGPSGCGKSTLGKLLAGYYRPQSGAVLLDGAPLAERGVCPVQLIHQHPEKAINPRWRMKRVLEEAGALNEALMARMGIEGAWLSRYPRELSGGELQRFCAARALFAGAKFLIADEMSAMLDVVTQAQIWHVALEEAQRRGIGLIAVTHNRALAQRISTRVVVFDEINGI